MELHPKHYFQILLFICLSLYLEIVLNGDSQVCLCGSPIQQCPIQGVIEHKKHRQTVTVYPWLPFVGQLVVCLFLPYGESDGFVLGGIYTNSK
ncbi:MAG: hypothetical protein NC394_10680 [Bacteroides sp.]|nr:hypothetical protein [Bacteroides sp.]